MFDPGHGVIHPAEPAQIAFFSTTPYKTVAVLNMSEVRKSAKLLYGAAVAAQNPLYGLEIALRSPKGQRPPVSIERPEDDAGPVVNATELRKMGLKVRDMPKFEGLDFVKLTDVLFEEIEFRDCSFSGAMEGVFIVDCEFIDTVIGGRVSYGLGGLNLRRSPFIGGAFLPNLFEGTDLRDIGVRKCEFHNALVGFRGDMEDYWHASNVFNDCDMTPTFLRPLAKGLDERFTVRELSSSERLKITGDEKFVAYVNFLRRCWCIAPVGILGPDGKVTGTFSKSLRWWLKYHKADTRVQRITDNLIENLRALQSGLEADRRDEINITNDEVDWEEQKPRLYLDDFMNSNFRVLEVSWKDWLQYLDTLMADDLDLDQRARGTWLTTKALAYATGTPDDVTDYINHRKAVARLRKEELAWVRAKQGVR